MSLAGKIARRTFVVAAVGGVVAAGAGFARLRWIDGYKLPAGEGETSFGAWLRFARDGKVEVAVPHQDMGQGIYALAVLLAAEGLRLPPDAVRAVQAPVDAHAPAQSLFVADRAGRFDVRLRDQDESVGELRVVA